ncbi:hypothetical protein PSMA106859_16290 [Pseudoalteromonas maricaloris]
MISTTYSTGSASLTSMCCVTCVTSSSPLSAGIRSKSDQSPIELVKPQAICVLLPAIISGRPGKETPVNLRSSLASCQEKPTRYQILGTLRFKCISLATKALPDFVFAPDTAQLLLPATEGLSCNAIVYKESACSCNARMS